MQRTQKIAGRSAFPPPRSTRLTGEVSRAKTADTRSNARWSAKTAGSRAAAGANVSAKTKMLFAETGADHPFVVEEQMMPMVPVVVVKNFEEAVAAAAKAEHNYRHSAIIHSLDVTRK